MAPLAGPGTGRAQRGRRGGGLAPPRRRVPVSLHYFAYGTTQRGFTHHRRLGLGEPVGRYRTVGPHAVVVPRRAVCSNPGCEYVHRMAALVAGIERHAEGDLFVIGDEAARAIEALETGPASPYVRRGGAGGAGPGDPHGAGGGGGPPERRRPIRHRARLPRPRAGPLAGAGGARR